MQATVIEDKPAKERVKFMKIYCIRPHRQIKFKTRIWLSSGVVMIHAWYVMDVGYGRCLLKIGKKSQWSAYMSPFAKIVWIFIKVEVRVPQCSPALGGSGEDPIQVWHPDALLLGWHIVDMHACLCMNITNSRDFMMYGRVVHISVPHTHGSYLVSLKHYLSF